MKAVVFHGIGDLRVEDVAEPRIEQPNDAIVRLTASAICGTDLHFVRGTFTGMRPGTIVGHEGVGVIEQLGPMVRNFEIGDRVVIPSTIACGNCAYCRDGYYAQCDTANPNGKRAGTAFFGGPEQSGPFHGLQAEKARVPFANIGLVKIPEQVSDDQALLLSDIFPTGYFGADLADIDEGCTVAVFGCGPVGQFAIASARLMGAGRIFAIDGNEDRLAMARRQGAETINFEQEDPVETLVALTGGIGVDRAIDAVGVDAVHAHQGPAAQKAKQQAGQNEQAVQQVAPQRAPEGGGFQPGDAPGQALAWAVEALAKAGTLAIIGVYPPTAMQFPIGQAMNKNLTLRMGNCNHRRYIPQLLELVRTGAFDPQSVLTQVESLSSAIEAYREFDARRPGWMKVELVPGRDGADAGASANAGAGERPRAANQRGAPNQEGGASGGDAGAGDAAARGGGASGAEREPPDREAGLGGSRERELERWGSQEPETMSERGSGTATGVGAADAPRGRRTH